MNNNLIRWQPNKLIAENHEGKLIQKFYNEILELPPSTNNNNKNIRRKSKQYKKQKKSLNKFNKKDLFQAAINNDIDLLKSMEITNENINELDAYGWTALMIASAAGSLDVVKYILVELNASVDVTDKAGNMAFTLANAKNHTNILKVFNDVFRKNQLTTEQQPFDNNDNIPLNNQFEPFYCESCEQTFYETTRKQHETSTVHKFNTIDGYKYTKRYHLSDSNRGFQMLLNLGWDRESGLGPDGKKGLLYPIRTTLRTYRSGLGLPQNTGIGCGVPRITHFSAYDLNAIKCQRRQHLLNNSNNIHFKTKKQIKNELQKDKRKEILLRNELS